ncbi:hypothetical protein LTR56_008230 [Elasticomyces elasticus]|nr:hypothetical protein LTR56_008230 [Elasticomyces elasticus]KAK3661793.1 hypothetical protein LTR22_007376 [Elasticomyces elasticus]KAK4924398.1 hypothetical protein LTR49_008489 [Elasticomyces elasticus]KAK5762638.1 hypothetical protein LTS12_007228 [Elasticomyces elasticus]
MNTAAASPSRQRSLVGTQRVTPSSASFCIKCGNDKVRHSIHAHADAERQQCRCKPRSRRTWTKRKQDVVDILRWVPPIVHIVRIPSADDDTGISNKIVRSFEHFGLRHYWTALLPVRLGEYPAVDSAAKTFVHAHCYSTSPSKEALRKVLRCYGETLRLLRNAMEKHNAAVLDETLMTVALVDLLAYSMKGSRAEGGNVPSNGAQRTGTS